MGLSIQNPGVQGGFPVSATIVSGLNSEPGSSGKKGLEIRVALNRIIYIYL